MIKQIKCEQYETGDDAIQEVHKTLSSPFREKGKNKYRFIDRSFYIN